MCFADALILSWYICCVCGRFLGSPVPQSFSRKELLTESHLDFGQVLSCPALTDRHRDAARGKATPHIHSPARVRHPCGAGAPGRDPFRTPSQDLQASVLPKELYFTT